MLSKIREKTQGIFASIILLLIVIPFALWGINSYFEGGPGTQAAKVNGEDISVQAYREAIERLRGRVEPSALESAAFRQMVLSDLIDRTLLQRDAEKNGYRVSNAQLARLIREVPQFQRDGRFDPALYQAFLRAEGKNAAQYELQLRQLLGTGQIRSGLSLSALVTESEIVDLARRLGEERTVAYVTVSPESFAAKVSVTEEDIRRHYEANADQYRSAEQVRVQYLELKASASDARFEPDEASLRRVYEEEAARYVTPEKRRVSHILIAVAEGGGDEQGRKAISEIERQLGAGQDFAALARKHSQDPDSAGKGGDLGELRTGMLPAALEQAARTLKLREVSKPVRTSYGYHLIKLTGLTPEKRRTFAEVRPELAKLLRQRQAEERFVDLAEKFRNLVYENPGSLQVPANTLELEIRESGWFTRSGGTGVARHPKVVEAAFDPEVLARTRNSDAIEVDGQTLVAVRVMEHRPASPRPLPEVRAEIERALRQVAARARAAELAQSLRKELEGGSADLARLAAGHGLKAQAEKTLRRDQSAGTDRRIVEEVFRAAHPQPGKAVYGLAEIGNQGVAVYALRRVNVPEATKLDAALRDKARRQLVELRGASLYASYRAAMRNQAKIEIFNDRL